ncbi:MAG: secretion protein HlyD, partial [Aestuariibacter sp.]|nr:secretion protein HlyD [Aestuariibacter sp.]MCP4946233.1 secretion protein HlyD [Aestuariibacter sp.]
MRTKAILLLTTLIVACSDQSGTSVQTARVLKQPLTASGEIVSLNTASISPPSVRGMWQMKVQFLVPENAHVKEGDMLVKFDDQQLKTKLIEQRSELEAESKNYQTKQLEDEAKLEELKLALAEAQMNYDKQK